MILPPPGFAQPIPDTSSWTLAGQEYQDINGQPYRGIWGYFHGVRIISSDEPCGALLHDPHFPHQIACSYPLGHYGKHQWMVEDYTKWPRAERQKP